RIWEAGHGLSSLDANEKRRARPAVSIRFESLPVSGLRRFLLALKRRLAFASVLGLGAHARSRAAGATRTLGRAVFGGAGLGLRGLSFGMLALRFGAVDGGCTAAVAMRLAVRRRLA